MHTINSGWFHGAMGIVTKPDGWSSVRIAVTGGAGFIGAPMARLLASQGHEVHVIDNLARGSGNRLHTPESRTRIVLHEADLRDPDRIEETFENVDPEAVVHLAAMHFIPDCVAHPAETLEINVLGTQHVLESTARTNARALFFASTADVYRPAVTPHRETDALSPGNVYGLSKLVGEMLIARWHEDLPRSCRVVIGRLFNVYGPGETNPHVLPEIMEQLRLGDALRLGNVTPRRDYVWVDDMATAVAAFLPARAPVPDDGVTTLNIGTGVSASVSEIVEILARVTGRPVRIETDPQRVRASDRPNLQADPSMLRSLFPGVTPTALEAGLRTLVETEGLG